MLANLKTLTFLLLTPLVFAAEAPPLDPLTDLGEFSRVRNPSKSGRETTLRYDFRLLGEDAKSSLVISNPSVQTGAVHFPSTAVLPESLKLAPGRTITLSADQLGWGSGAAMTVKMSSHLQAALRSDSQLVRLPNTHGPRSYSIFSNTLRPDVVGKGAGMLVIPLDSSRISAAYGAPRGVDAEQLPRVAGEQPAPALVDIALGETVSGTLDPNDARARFDETVFADNYRLTLSSPQTIRIVMQSAIVDSYITVFDADEDYVGENDDGDDESDSLDSLLELTLPPGEYIIEASSFGTGESGPYTLSVVSLGPANPQVVLSVGQTVNGTLEPSDNRSFIGDGAYADYYELNVATTQSLVVTLRSEDFDAYLLVADLDRGRVIENDDGGGDTDSQVELVFEPGSHFIEASSFDAREQGAYTLEISPSASPLPIISREGVISSAGFIGGSLAPGEILSFFGTDIGPNQLAGLEFGSDGRVLTEIGGTRILFNGQPAPMVFSITNQASAVAPFSLAVGTTVAIQVEKNGRLSNVVQLPVVAAKPTIFSINQSGTGPGAVLNQDFALNSAANPAKRGAAIQIFLTGGGQTSPASEDGELAPSAAPLAELLADVSVTIGGQPAQVLYKGGAPGLINGLVQVNALVAEGTPTGDAVELVVTIGGVASQAGITVSVE